MKTRILIVLLLWWAGPAHADDAGRMREHYLKGTKAFDLGFYDDAIAEYLLAYQAKDSPALLFNLGQANRLSGHLAEALRFYRVYLTKMPRAANRAEVELKIAELQGALDQQKR